MALSDDAKELKGILGEIKAAMDGTSKSSKAMADGFRANREAMDGLIDAAQQFAQNQKNMSSDELIALSEKIKKHKEDLQLSQTSLEKQIKSTEIQKKLNQAEINRLKSVSAISGLNKKQLSSLKRLQEENISLTQTIFDQKSAYEQANDVLEDMDGSIHELENSLDKAAKKAKGIELLQKFMDGFGNAIDNVRTPLDGLLGPLKIIQFFIDMLVGGVTDWDKRIGESAKSMNRTYEETEKSHRAMMAFSDANRDFIKDSDGRNHKLKVTYKQITEISDQYQALLGTSVPFEKMEPTLQRDVTLMAELQTYAGLTGEETQSILKYSQGTGKSAENVTKELMASYKVQGLKSGLVLNEKDAMKAIAKTAKAIQMSYGGNAKELGKALASAKGLGVELNKVDDIAGSLLNFEESIENELSAELLTGKELNLEKARSAALNNDLATVAEEITKQVGSAAEFQEMNRIQQDAIAKSVGMTREELAGSLMEQEALKNIGAASLEEARKKYDTLRKTMSAEEAMKALGDEALANQFEQATTQERITSQQDQMQQKMLEALPSMKNMGDGMVKFMETIQIIIDKLGGMKTILAIIGTIIAAKLVKGVIDYAQGASKAIKAMKAWQAAEKGGAIVSIIKGAWSSLGPIPFVGAGLAIAAIAGGMAYLASQMASADDAILPAAGGSGYGKRVMFGPEGAIQFNNKDTIVAGTDLFADDAVMEPGMAARTYSKGAIRPEGGGGQDMSSVVSAITALANRPVNVGIDGTKVIEATTGAQPNTFGDATARNSYRMQ